MTSSVLVNFSYIIDNEIAGCAYPGSFAGCAAGLAELRANGIEALVSLTEEALPLYLIADFGFHYLHVPIPDFASPTMDDALRFIEFARMQRDAGRPIAVHCRAGYGRTGTILACYLVWRGMTAIQAISEVRRLRPGSIETAEQEAFVERFARGE